MSNYTVPPNGYEPYHGQAQGQAYPPHQEGTVPQQEHYQYSPAAHPYSEPQYAGAATGYPPPYSERPPQNYPRSEYPPQVSNQEHGYGSYPPNQEKGSGENASYYTAVPQDQANGVNTGPGVGPEGEGERGLGSTLLGGAAGGYAGHKMQGGFLGTAGGAVLGAVGMNMVSHEM
ncbi:uncharacterized protein N7503_000241 [Penicillium pulvis]|uniref:uncharacterized protein n=1 Tax=Penicillium pulvis TaxID=1562058 RepID=UPI0025481444|nr:uncharacterized protein N7503_000241 [Penicillium pulvis]KAJ5813491.1 hypothetical protein N7503_000241 [Penicillium pulvis]